MLDSFDTFLLDSCSLIHLSFCLILTCAHPATNTLRGQESIKVRVSKSNSFNKWDFSNHPILHKVQDMELSDKSQTQCIYKFYQSRVNISFCFAFTIVLSNKGIPFDLVSDNISITVQNAGLKLGSA